MLSDHLPPSLGGDQPISMADPKARSLRVHTLIRRVERIGIRSPILLTHDDAVAGTKNQLLNGGWFRTLIRRDNETRSARQAGLSGSVRLHAKPTVLPPLEGQAQALFEPDSRSVA